MTALLESQVVRKITLTASAGVRRYYIPVGLQFRDAPEESGLLLNGTAQVLGADYIHLRRYQPPTTVADAAIGFELAASPKGGETLQFRWRERRILSMPSSVTLRRLVDSGSGWEPDPVLDLTPNGVTISSPPSPYVIEFWRMTRNRKGSVHEGKRLRGGRRYLPYFRGPSTQSADPSTFHVSEFSASGASPRRKFRVCYYNPETGARSDLSPETIAVVRNQVDSVMMTIKR